MSKDLIRLMNALFLPGGLEACQSAPWQPNMDVYRTSAGWLIKFELAGVRAEDIDLQVLDHVMTLRGVRRDMVREDCQKKGESCPVHHRMEIAYSKFERALELPCDLKRAEITTDYRDGLLLVRVTPEQRNG
jgi:HSP20 family protein